METSGMEERIYCVDVARKLLQLALKWAIYILIRKKCIRVGKCETVMLRHPGVSPGFKSRSSNVRLQNICQQLTGPDRGNRGEVSIISVMDKNLVRVDY